MPERRVKLFRNWLDQAVHIPRAFELSGEDAIMRKEGKRLIIEQAPPKSLLAALAALETLDEDFPLIPDASPDLPPASTRHRGRRVGDATER